MMNSCLMMNRIIGRRAGNPDRQVNGMSELTIFWPEGRPPVLEGGGSVTTRFSRILPKGGEHVVST